jgi:hypothetical protein
MDLLPALAGAPALHPQKRAFVKALSSPGMRRRRAAGQFRAQRA